MHVPFACFALILCFLYSPLPALFRNVYVMSTWNYLYYELLKLRDSDAMESLEKKIYL